MNRRLESKPEGCVVWVVPGNDFLDPSEFTYRWFPPGNVLGLEGLQLARHPKANAQGIRSYRRNTVKLPRNRFVELGFVEELIKRLFGLEAEALWGGAGD